MREACCVEELNDPGGQHLVYFHEYGASRQEPVDRKCGQRLVKQQWIVVRYEKGKMRLEPDHMRAPYPASPRWVYRVDC